MFKNMLCKKMHHSKKLWPYSTLDIPCIEHCNCIHCQRQKMNEPMDCHCTLGDTHGDFIAEIIRVLQLTSQEEVMMALSSETGSAQGTMAGGLLTGSLAENRLLLQKL